MQLPFCCSHVFLKGITRLAAGNDIAFARESALGNRNNMVHGDILFDDSFLAVVASGASRNNILPPARLSQLAGFVALFGDVLLAYFNVHRLGINISARKNRH